VTDRVCYTTPLTAEPGRRTNTSMHRIDRAIGVSVILAFVTSIAIAKDDGPLAKLYEPATYANADGEQLPYRILKPAQYDSTRKYPLVMFFHGAGERGDDNFKQLVHCAATFASPANMDKYPCFVVFPQCPAKQRWVEVDWALPAHTQPVEPGQAMRLSMELLASLKKQFSIDERRIYVSGLSMGGFATWDLISRYPKVFAAAVPICGGGDESKAAACAKVPVWAFHSADDNVVKVERTRNMIEAMRKAGGDPRYTEYTGLGHFSWGKAYSEAELLPWLFAQSRAQ
jgi:predicted peptidase